MSEKNGQGGAHWTKTAAAAAAATTAAAIQKHNVYDVAINNNNSNVVHTPSALYGHCSIPGLHQQQPTDVAYTSGRFQAPPIHHGTVPAPTVNTPANLHQQISPTMIPTPTPTNVPAPSGFVPPPFPTNTAAAATSVLTPNPFAASNNPSLAFVAAAGAASAFGNLEHFQRLSAAQQQLELGKIMNAMNSSGQNATSPSVPTIAGSQMPPTAAAQQPVTSTSRAHAETVSGSTNMGAINSTIADNVLNAISSGQGQLQGRLTHVGVKAPDEEKMRRVQQVVESNLDDFSKQTITQILERVGTLKPVERLLLYLRLPGETAESDPLRQPQNPLGTRSEITHTINWVRSHLEHDPQVSIPKQDVYNDYITYCERLNIKPLSTADFGKVMKQVFPGIRPRRLGTRGNSRYCYAAMRKTTQLVMPQLPQLGRNSSSKTTTVGSIATASSEFSPEKTTIDDADDESWEVVKNWAEKLLNVKVDNLKELAARIKSGSAISGVNTPTTMRMGPKKYTPREPKEKRLLADLGPLKKRRKKKRKGSSSSESSCNQQTSAKDCTSSQDSGAYHAVTSVGSVLLSEDEQKSIKLVKVKQEIMDSPNFQSTQAQVLLPHPQLMPQNAMLNDTFNVTQQQQQQQQQPQQHQVMPMNLATEQRTVLAKAPPSNSALRGHFGAARNLTAKIMEMSPSQQALTISGQPGSEQVGPTAHAQNQQTLVSIKDEVDEYSTSPIFCKKVLKAQQTKGFWTNLPNSNNNNNNMLPPIITTTASTPPPTSANIIANVSLDTVVTPLSVSTTVTNLAMGPPAQMANSTSVSPSSSLEAGPKVVSRNSFLLRAKKALASETAAPVEDACLPENLGLPRERVISICNMDKHELDDYFLEEGENEEDQETELLQYFQTGDAEEKRMNSLDAAENRNPTANNATIVNQIKITTTTTMTTSTSMTTTATTTATSILNIKTGGVTITPIGDVLTSATPTMIAAPVANTAKAKTPLELNACVVSTITPTVVNESSVGGDVGLQVSTGQNVALSQTIKLPPTLTSNAVGSASASLALMSQKHQLQQQQHQKQLKQKQQQQQHQRSQTNKLNANNNKRKISLSNASNHNNNKNCIFLPISPNINNTPASLTSSSTNLTNNNQNGNFASSSNAPSCFASPGLTRLRTRAPTLTKQQSLDFETSDNSSDPMIGASRRRRSYISAMPSSTSASAPPSPSVLQQYNSINAWSLGSNMNNTTTFNDAATNVALLADQNSMDLENTLALATAAGDVDFQLTPLNETQRSQSVPLSQLQRIQSPTFSRQLDGFQPIYTADSSVNQTPEFAGDSTTLFSENSNSQSAMKLHDVDVLAQDSSVLLDDVDVSAMLSSPDFSTKFSSIAQTQNAATTCSSTGSSSGYSSGTCNTFGGMTGGGSGNGIISRSVPSTPLPHHYQNSFVNSSFYNRRNDDFNLSPLTAGASLHGFGNTANNQNSNIHNNNSNNSHGGNFYTARAVYDISKSMPTTPISTVSFLYSPTRFLINGNTIDSFTSSTYGGTSGGGGGRDDATDELGVGQLSTDTLIDDSAATSDVEAIMAGSDILGNL